jgi:glycosyltransferase involved in cell wall biosynthesis
MPEIPPRSPIADAPLSMILIASNAELFLDHLLERWRGALKSKVQDFEIVLVDDASTDGTLVQATALKKKHPGLTIVSSEAPHGVGAAWRAGLAATQPRPLLGFAEFSPDYNPDDVAKFLEVINEVDLISGMRANPPSRWTGRALLDRWIFGVRLKDATCPFKLMRRTVFDHLRLQSRGDFVQTEVVAKANFLGCLLAEVGVDCLRAGTAAPDPYWQQDMKLVFSSPDFGPPPPPKELASAEAAALSAPATGATAAEEEIL